MEKHVLSYLGYSIEYYHSDIWCDYFIKVIDKEGNTILVEDNLTKEELTTELAETQSKILELAM